MALRALVLGRAGHPDTPLDGEQARRITDAYLQTDAEYQQLAVDDQLTAMTRSAIAGGWTPLDLYELARRRLDAALIAHLLAAIAGETVRHNRTAVHADWIRQLQQLDATPATDGSRAWAQGHRIAWAKAHAALIELLVLLASVPRLEQVLPPPGAATSGVAGASHVDEGVLRKVRALLAKAESTEYENEADALTAKAQQLMTTHSIERALAETGEPQRSTPIARRMWLDAPYVESKALLVDAVAASNHCRCVLTKAWDFVTLVGHEPDLDTIELLSTSLLVQATRTMTALGSQTSRSGTSQTRSFRRSFLAAYAIRIEERLTETAADIEMQADAQRGGSVLPVLASRDDAVGDVAAALFPQLQSRRVSISNPAGWGAGRAAADLARLDFRGAVDGERAG